MASEINPSAGGKPQADPRQYLNPVTLARITQLDLRARLVIEGLISGMHRSPYHGFSVEFAEHREYAAGDDIKYLDWKVYGRSDRYYIKQYEEETNLQLVLLVDTSESMGYRSAAAAMSKYEYAVTIAASLGYLALKQSDSVGLGLFSDKLYRFLRPSNQPAFWRTLVQEMHAEVGPKKTDCGQVFHELAERLTHRSLVVVLSDLFGDPKRTISGMKHLHYKRHELMVLHVLDPYELEFPFESPTLFKGLEQMGQLLTEPRALRRRYLEEVEKFTQEMKRGCRTMRADFKQFSTSDSLDAVLSTFLANRNATIKRR